jgi:hypothetical protein
LLIVVFIAAEVLSPLTWVAKIEMVREVRLLSQFLHSTGASAWFMGRILSNVVRQSVQ